MQLKKSYRGFVLWMAGFFAVSVGAMFLTEDDTLAIRIIENICTISVAALTCLIYRTEAVYWYTGTSYEDAVEAGQRRRKAFAWEHCKRFGWFAAVFLVLSALAQWKGISVWIDFTLFCIGLLATAVSTIRIQL